MIMIINIVRIGITLSDKFEYAAWPLENTELAINQTCVTLCPDLESLGVPTCKGTPFWKLGIYLTQLGLLLLMKLVGRYHTSLI